MIVKLSTGKGFGGTLSYILRNGESDEERQKVKVLSASGVDYDINSDGTISLDVREVARDFRFQAMMHPTVRKPVYHFSISWKVGEHIPSKEKLERAEEFMRKIDFKNTQFVFVEHEKENEHIHAIANIVDNDGNRISTKELIPRIHKAALEITKKYGYALGEPDNKETIEKVYNPHEKVRYIIKPIVKEAVSKAKKIEDLPGLLEPSGIGCVIKYSDAKKAVGITFTYEKDGQIHPFRGSNLDRSLSAINIIKTINTGIKTEQADIAKTLKDTYISMFPTVKKLNNTVKKAFELLNESKNAGVAINALTTEKYSELEDTWNKFNEQSKELKNAKTDRALIKTLGGMLVMLNPVVGLLVMAVGSIATDIRISSIKAEKKALLGKIEEIKSDIDALKTQKDQINIERKERLNQYLQAKDTRNEFRQRMNTIKAEIDALKEQLNKPVQPSEQEIHEMRIQELKEKYPFKEPGHIMYIVHSQTNASIFHAGLNAKVFRAKRIKGGTFDDDRIEAARCMLKDRGYMVAGDRGPDEHDGFYERLLEEQKYEDFRIGNMYIQSDGTVIFGEEMIFGNPENTAPALKHEPEPAVNPKDENVSIYNDGRSNFRIKKEEDGTYKLLHQDWDNKSFVNGKATKKKWYIKKKFTSFSEIGRDKNYLYLKIQDLSGKTMYINQYGNNLTDKQLKSLGIKTNGRTM